MADDKEKKRTVYCLSKKIPDENYDVYVGSTCNTMSQRLSEHMSECKRRENSKNIKLYKRMTEVGSEKWKIVPLFEKTCGKNEIRSFEKKWVETLDANLNSPFSKNGRQHCEEVKRYQRRNIIDKKYFCNVCE